MTRARYRTYDPGNEVIVLAPFPVRLNYVNRAEETTLYQQDSLFDITLPLIEAQFYAYRRTQKKFATGWAVVTIWTSLGENLIYIFTKLPLDEQKAVHCMQFLSVHLWLSLVNDLNSVVNFWESLSGKLWEMKISQPIIISLIKDSGLLF